MAKPSGWHRKRKNTPAEQARTAQYASPEHRAMRKVLGELVAAGRGFCWRCGRHIPPGGRWHTGHDDYDRSRYRGVECPPCNLKTAASKGARQRNGPPGPTRIRL